MKPEPAKATCSSCQWKGKLTDCRWENIEYDEGSYYMTADIYCPKCNKKLEKNHDTNYTRASVNKCSK